MIKKLKSNIVKSIQYTNIPVQLIAELISSTVKLYFADHLSSRRKLNEMVDLIQSYHDGQNKISRNLHWHEKKTSLKCILFQVRLLDTI